MTTSDICRELGLVFDRMNWPRNTKIWGDPSRPDNIEEMNRAGFNVEGAVNDITYGIDVVKTKPLVIQRGVEGPHPARSEDGVGRCKERRVHWKAGR